MKICYVTGNKLKVDLANRIFKDLYIEIIQENIETPEIQSLDCEEVAKYSAKYAADLLGKPVFKNDSGIVIPALGGFPGPLSKYAESTIGADGWIRLMDGLDRKCHWIEVLAYCEPGKEPVSFTSISYGRIADSVHDGEGYPYDKIYIPDGDTRTFSEMSYDEHLSYYSDEAYIKLYEYLKERNK